MIRYGGRTERSWQLSNALSLQEGSDILITDGLNLENGIPQTQSIDTLCTEGEPDMANRKRFKVILSSGETIWLTGNTISEAFQNGLNRLSHANTPPCQKAPLLKDFVETTYKPTYYVSLKPKTVTNYEQYLKYNILPFLGNKRMDEIDVTTIQSFYNWMASASEHGRKKNLNKNTITRIGGFTSRIFTVAQEMKIINDTPFKKTLLKINAEPGGHHKALPDELVDHVKRNVFYLQRPEERLYIGLLVFTGMRLEELLGLKWEDIHLDDSYLTIKRTVTHPDNSAYDIGPTKSEDSARTIPIVSPLAALLRPLVKCSGFILGDDKPWYYSKVQRTYRRAAKFLGIQGYSNHDFRTTFATQLCENGITSKQCAGLMGHADTRMVETTYANERHEGTMKRLPDLESLNKKYNPQSFIS